MNNSSLIYSSIEHLANISGRSFQWKRANGHEVFTNGYLLLENNTSISIVFKKNINGADLAYLTQLKSSNPNFVVLCGKIYPSWRAKLKMNNVNYLDSAGNAFINLPSLFIYVEGQKNYPVAIKTKRQLFSKTSIKVIFHFLAQPQLIEQPYRTIAQQLNVSLGTITNTIHQLQEQSFLLKNKKTKWQWYRRKSLLEEWITAYQQKLKPDLLLGNYRFVNKELPSNWVTISLPKNSWWGEEAAGKLETDYLRPGILTIYTEKEALDLMKSLHLLPDETGNIKIYQKFWQSFIIEGDNKITPSLLTYADLIGTGLPRNLETAQLIWDEKLKNKF